MIELGAVLWGSEVRTWGPVSAASAASTPVSWSRTSPTRITSGSWRRIERSAPANVRPRLGATWTWLIPPIWYSTGSSTETTLISGLRTALSAAYKVVLLPEPVGPVTSTRPYGERHMRRNSWRTLGSQPSASSDSTARLLSSSRHTTFSPQ